MEARSPRGPIIKGEWASGLNACRLRGATPSGCERGQGEWVGAWMGWTKRAKRASQETHGHSKPVIRFTARMPSRERSERVNKQTVICLCGCARGRVGARTGAPASVRENRPKALPTGGFCCITH